MSKPSTLHAAAVHDIYAAGAAPDRWPEVLTRLSDHIGAIGGMIAYHGPVGRPGYMVVGRLRDDLSGPYLTHYARNPITLAAGRAPPLRVQIAGTLVDMAALRRTAFHADILHPQRIVDHVNFTCASLTPAGGAGGIGGFAFSLTSRQAEDARRAALRLGRLAAHLSRALDISLQIGRAQDCGHQTEQTLDAMSGPAFLLRGDGALLRANAAGEGLLKRADGVVAVRAGALHLVAQIEGDARALGRAIVAASAAARDEDDADFISALRIARPSGRPPLIVVLTPLPPSAFPMWRAVDDGARVLVQIVDPQAPATLQAKLLGAAVGLTPAEARVAALVGGGLGAAEAAKTLGVSLTTVKTHLARCFDKTGLHSQAALARLIAAIPAGRRTQA